MPRSVAVASCVAVLSGSPLATAQNPHFLIPNGNPTGAASAERLLAGTSTLDPSPASYRVSGDCPWLVPALGQQGFTAANGWTINYAALQGTLTLDIYLAWVNTDPAVACGNIDEEATAYARKGGSEICITYQPAGADPSGADVRWLQAVRTNSPMKHGEDNGHDAGGGYFLYLDNGWHEGKGVGKDPYYGANDIKLKTTGYLADDVGFNDGALRPFKPGADWEAQVFIAKGNLAAKTITIYDGVWWGYMTEPQAGCAAEGDIDGDDVVDIEDFLALLGAWGFNPDSPADLNHDGNVGVIDFLTLLGAWGPCDDATYNILANAEALPGYSCLIDRSPYVLDTTFATTDGPSHPGCGFGGDSQIHNDVWFCFNAPATHEVFVTLTDCTFESRLAVYQGCGSAGDGNLIACNEHADVSSRVTFQAVAGNSYLIRAGGASEGQVGRAAIVVCPTPDIQCGSAQAESCCDAHETPACGDAGCCQAVCAGDAYCCDLQWDQVCVEEAYKTCGGECVANPGCPGPGNCFEPHGNPGCEDPLCCTTVCAQLPLCCLATWDQGCVDAAVSSCKVP